MTVAAVPVTRTRSKDAVTVAAAARVETLQDAVMIAAAAPVTRTRKSPVAVMVAAAAPVTRTRR